MIVSYKKGNKLYEFYNLDRENSENIYTIIVGKNGSGKSRLLNEIIENFIPINLIKRHGNSKTGELKVIEKPNKIIAVSTSPYDKFPLIRPQYYEPILNTFYSYIGIRDVKSFDISLGFMSKIIKELLYIRLGKEGNYKKIINVLKYLGYSDELLITFEIGTTNVQVKRFLEDQDLNNLSRGPSKINRYFFEDEHKIEKIEKLKTIFFEYDFRKVKRTPTVTINIDQIYSEMHIDDLLFLIESGVARLKDVEIMKLETDRIHKISDASSGQQCIFTTFLGIACHIEDNSLIVIDEPEISLHPEWQERYITLLMETFQNYKNCHFIIATHSPQIIARLSEPNCFILQMDNMELKNGHEMANNSVDFQLANVFNTPGFKNEYLARISFSIISKVGKTNKFDDEDINNFELLKSQIKNLQSNDPIRGLFELIKELRRNG
ncbi:ATP-binding protein [Chryseobacterium scophthalmum]|uniref:ATP-binding protein n=1 Tax=Chryseobacterium scophthalmum TaxID=59733 RepID=UPI000C9E1FAF|nr:ATP-binding protein [Chryseobacterium scophthalmum]